MNGILTSTQNVGASALNAVYTAGSSVYTAGSSKVTEYASSAFGAASNGFGVAVGFATNVVSTGSDAIDSVVGPDVKFIVGTAIAGATVMYVAIKILTDNGPPFHNVEKPYCFN